MIEENIRKYKDMTPKSSNSRNEQWYIDQYNRNRAIEDHIEKNKQMVNPAVNSVPGYDGVCKGEYRHPTQEDIIEFNKKECKKNEMVDHPTHYGGEDNPYEAIKVIEVWGLGFNLGNVVKYISRVGKKGNRVEDLEKSIWYINREIKKLKNER